MRITTSPSFRALLELLRSQHAEACWLRARLASRLAKLARDPRSRRLAYETKVAAASRAIELAPSCIQPGDERFTNLGVVGVHFRDVGGLHIPLRALPPQAAEIVKRRRQV